MKGEKKPFLLLEEARLMSEKNKKSESRIDLFEMTVGELVIEAKPMTATHTLERTCTPTHPAEADKDEKLTAKSAKFLDHVKLQ